MGLFDELERNEEPRGRNRSNDFTNRRISVFVADHFYEIKDIRDKGYSWGQIAQFLQNKYNLDMFSGSIASVFNLINRKRINS